MSTNIEGILEIGSTVKSCVGFPNFWVTPLPIPSTLASGAEPSTRRERDDINLFATTDGINKRQEAEQIRQDGKSRWTSRPIVTD
jgi:hypothetical protein